MLYAILCYHSEDVVCSWPKEKDEQVMRQLTEVTDNLAKAGRLGPVARLLPTTAATTVRENKREDMFVIDGPFAETKEQLLGFFVIDCTDLDEAVATAKQLMQANDGATYEIRPIGFFMPGVQVLPGVKVT